MPRSRAPPLPLFAPATLRYCRLLTLRQIAATLGHAAGQLPLAATIPQRHIFVRFRLRHFRLRLLRRRHRQPRHFAEFRQFLCMLPPIFRRFRLRRGCRLLLMLAFASAADADAADARLRGGCALMPALPREARARARALLYFEARDAADGDTRRQRCCQDAAASSVFAFAGAITDSVY